MNLSAAPEQAGLLTKIILVRRGAEGGDIVESGSGWAWVQPRIAESRNWRRCRMWAVVEFRSTSSLASSRAPRRS